MQLTDVLSAEHYEEIILGSSVDPSVALARGYRTLYDTDADRAELENIGYRPSLYNREDSYPGLLIPMTGATGEVRGWQFKPRVPRTRRKDDQTDVPIKYESVPGMPNCLDVPAFTREAMQTDGTALWITEGMKKVDSLCSQGLAALGLTGVFNWKSRLGTLGDWEDIPLKGRPVVVCFDSDANSNRNVQLAMSRLGAWLKTRGVSQVHYVITPGEVDGVTVKGVDDFFTAGGTVQVLFEAATQTPPGAGEKDAAFTDAMLVEDLAEALETQFCWASGLGWLRWDGRLWKEVPDVEPLEAVRVWASEKFEAALSEQRKDPSRNMSAQIAGWRSILGKSRLTALRDLLRGLLQQDAGDFDGDPDLMTCSNGTIHLPSGRLLPFDPAHHITKSANAVYRPGHTHPVWVKALSAVPVEIREWYRDRIGQAASGHPTADHVMVVSHGDGSNGKSTVVDVIRRTFGDYGILVSDRVLMANPDAHPTELMDLRGVRYAVLEETPEARHLNVQRLKATVGTPVIRARRIRQDTVEFLASHSLFINTNHKPVVTETDWGTWRRLALMPWPYTFVKPPNAPRTPWEREGDPVLQYAANDADVRSAALSWIVDGARAWYARNRVMLELPQMVEGATRKWRSETDLILGFADDCLTFQEGAFTVGTDMLKTFNDWADGRGHRPWNDRTFASRFGSHESVKQNKVENGRQRMGGKQVRGWHGVTLRQDDDPWDSGVGEEPEPFVPAPREEMPSVPPNPTPELPRQQSVVGFDLETASVDQLFLGGHEGPYVRLAGVVEDDGDATVFRNGGFVRDALAGHADVIYGHNVFGFDLLALARHCGADYDVLAKKTVDLMVLARLLDPPMSKKMPNDYYGLDAIAQRQGHEGKTDDLKALAKEYGGYDKIPLDSRRYQEYLRGDLAATRAVWEELSRQLAEQPEAQQRYAAREMDVVAFQNRMTLNGWRVDAGLLGQRVAEEKAKQDQAVEILHTEFGMPLARPDRYKLLPKAQWPAELRSIAITDARVILRDRPQECVDQGMAEMVPGEVYDAPWSTDRGREAIENAFRAAGAEHWPTTESGQLALKADALGDKPWYAPWRGKSVPGMLQIHGDKPGVRRIVETLNLATGARAKYAEMSKFVTADSRVHAAIGDAQGSGRWAHVKPAISTMGKRGAAAAERDVMIADDGHMLVTADLSQVDMRAMAGLSQDRAYMALFEPGRDAHSEMAVVYFGSLSEETRQRTKAINHKLNYGGGARSTAEMNGIPLEVVEQAVAARAEAYPRLVEYIQEVRDLAASGALLDNGFGRLMRPDPERAWTQGPALMGQGAARDIMTESILRLIAARPDVMPYLRAVVHDELILSVPAASVEEWQGELRRAMTWEWRGVPILCDVSKPALRWSDCK